MPAQAAAAPGGTQPARVTSMRGIQIRYRSPSTLTYRQSPWARPDHVANRPSQSSSSSVSGRIVHGPPWVDKSRHRPIVQTTSATLLKWPDGPERLPFSEITEGMSSDLKQVRVAQIARRELLGVPPLDPLLEHIQGGRIDS